MRLATKERGPKRPSPRGTRPLTALPRRAGTFDLAAQGNLAGARLRLRTRLPDMWRIGATLAHVDQGGSTDGHCACGDPVSRR